MAQKLLDFESNWINGVDSSVDPSQLAPGTAWSAINMINISGVWSCRPGYRCILKLPKGNLQGAAIFRPQLGLEQMLFAVDGLIYVSTFPFNRFDQVQGLQFLSYAKQVFFTQTVQSARRITPGDLASAIELIEPKAVMIIQDGGFTAPGFYDGSNAGHIKGIPFQTPAGGTSEWVGDRLWVSSGKRVFASDISNPFSFVEQIYLGGASAFYFSRDVTAMIKTPSVDSPQLLVFTDEDTTLIQASQRDRNLWPVIEGFQKEIVQIGCTSDRAVASQYGRLFWFSSSGLVIFNPATSQYLSSEAPARDNEMMVSKRFLRDDLSQVAFGTMGQWLLISVPSEDDKNLHTWVLNNASFEKVAAEGQPVWNGYWLGTRPVEWICGTIANAERAYHVSIDADGENRLWETFRPERMDSDSCPITWALFTRGQFGPSSPGTPKTPGVTCRHQFSDIGFTDISDDTDVGVQIAPGVRGRFHPIATRMISVEKGSLSFDRRISGTDKIYAFKPQSRILRTEDLSLQNPDVESGSCPVESNLNDDVEESFQLLIVGRGPATLRWVRSFAVEAPQEDFAGSDVACQNEAAGNLVRYDGEAVFNPDIEAGVRELAAKPEIVYHSTQTESVTAYGITAVGAGTAESTISQSSADRAARLIAIRMAEVEIAQAAPKFLSLGLE